jgi:amino acid transporter
MVSLALLSIASIAGAAARSDLAARLLVAPPAFGAFVAATGQALFLFMGFELVTSQAEAGATPRAIGRSMVACVALVAAFYALVSAGFSCLAQPPSAPADRFVPQLALASDSTTALAAVVVLSILASFTSFNGALLAFSRFLAALASQGLVPRRLGRLDPGSLAPRDALGVLLAVAIGATLAVSLDGAMDAAILAAACAAALLYAAAAYVRERAPFAETARPWALRLLGNALVVGFATLGVGVITDAGPSRFPTIVALALAGAASFALARRARPPTRRLAHVR